MVIAIIGVLAALLLPVLARAKDAAATAECNSNLRQISLATLMYREDYDGLHVINTGYNDHAPPPFGDHPKQIWSKILVQDYPEVIPCFKCPAQTVKCWNGSPNNRQYALNLFVIQESRHWKFGLLSRLHFMRDPSSTLHLTDAPGSDLYGNAWALKDHEQVRIEWMKPGKPFHSIAMTQHLRRFNRAWADGHVSLLETTDVYGWATDGDNWEVDWLTQPARMYP